MSSTIPTDPTASEATAAPATSEAAVPSDDFAIIARQAIVNEDRVVFGYELFDRSTAHNAHTAASDAALLFNALSYADAEALVGKKIVFINCTHESLSSGHLELIHPDKVVLEVPTLNTKASTEEITSCLPVFESLTQRGFRIALDQNALLPQYMSWLPYAAFIKLDLAAFKLELAAPLVKFVRTHAPTARIVAEKVETAQQHEHMSQLGINLFQGYWFAQPALVKAQTVRPSQAAIIQLLNLVRKQATTTEIEDLLKKDPTLSFNLLRFINSSGFGLSCEITSFRHAVMILGLKKLFRWAALLLTTSRKDGAAPAVGQTAVVRGRLMELLAEEMLPAEDCDNAFLVGVFSLLDTMLGMPMERALESVALPDHVIDALLHQKGLLAPFLELTKACESGDDVAFARCAEQLGLSNHQVNMAHMNALIWAENLTAE